MLRQYIHCFQFLLGSSGYRFQMVAPSLVAALFHHLVWLTNGWFRLKSYTRAAYLHPTPLILCRGGTCHELCTMICFVCILLSAVLVNVLNTRLFFNLFFFCVALASFRVMAIPLPECQDHWALLGEGKAHAQPPIVSTLSRTSLKTSPVWMALPAARLPPPPPHSLHKSNVAQYSCTATKVRGRVTIARVTNASGEVEYSSTHS
jgi:hypothetical protein